MEIVARDGGSTHACLPLLLLLLHMLMLAMAQVPSRCMRLPVSVWTCAMRVIFPLPRRFLGHRRCLSSPRARSSLRMGNQSPKITCWLGLSERGRCSGGDRMGVEMR
jgi:hypothetical protein